MKNIIKIVFFQSFLTFVKRIIFKKIIQKKNIQTNYIDEIDYFYKNTEKSKLAILTLPVISWLNAVQSYPNIKKFNTDGLVFEIIKSLNYNGYKVTLIDLNFFYLPTKKIDLCIAHGGKSAKIVKELPKETIVLQYLSGMQWEEFNKLSKYRYSDFIKKRKIKNNIEIKRSIMGREKGEQYLNDRANYLFTLFTPHIIKQFSNYQNKLFNSGYGSYPDKLFQLNLNEKNFEQGRTNFIYVAGTGGNIQKGLDLLLEAFSKTPHLNLYIYCEVEEEIIKYCKKELSNKNIHYIYHWRFPVYHNRLKNLLKRTNYTIHACYHLGIGTAFMGSMATGLIPVGSLDLLPDNDWNIIVDSWDVVDLVKVIKEASQKSPEWCKQAAVKTIAYSKENWSVEHFSKKMDELIRKVDEM